MPEISAATAPTVVYRSNRARFAWLPVTGIFSFLLPLFIFWIQVPNAPRTGLVLSMLMGPIGVGITLIGIAYFRLRIETSEQGLRVALPATGSDPWFPWLVKRVTISWSEIIGIDTSQRPWVHAPYGVERRVVLRTQQGDYHLNSIWFREFDAIVGTIQARTGYEMTVAPLINRDGQLQWKERFVRCWGWVCFATGLFMTVGYGVLSLSGRTETGPFYFIFVLMFFLFYPWIQRLIRYRVTV